MKFFTNKSGVVSIVALAIFAVLTIFGLIISGIVTRSYDSVRTTNGYYLAQDIGESTIEFLNQEIQRFGPGYNTPNGIINCSYNLENQDQNNPDYCDQFSSMIGDNEVTIAMEIKGRLSEEQNINTGNCTSGRRIRMNDNCYVVPFPSTGSAGEDCQRYQPNYSNDGSPNMPENIVGENEIDQLDYPCNWNKLTLGSDLTSRVAIPLYYTNQENETIEPYKADQGAAENFILRMRTPCLPCVYGDQQAQEGISRQCQRNQNPNICTNQERYQLDGQLNQENDDIIVQWQINGICEGDEDCGLVADLENPGSVISESKINRFNNNFNILLSDSIGIQNNLDQNNLVSLGDFTNNVSNPTLSIFVSEALKSSFDQNVPYLEYQFLSEYPVSNDQVLITTNINLNNNSYNQESWIPIKIPLIDFAIQN